MKRLLVVACAAFLSGPLVAAPVIFTDRATFNTQAPGLAVEDFEASRAPDDHFLVIDAPLDSTSSNAAFLPGEILAGLQLTNRPGSSAGGLVATGTGELPGATRTVLANTFADSLDLIFAAGISAVGFDFYSTPGPGLLSNADVSIELFDLVGGSLGVFTANAISTGSAFFGAITDGALIGRVSILSNSSESEAVDNIAFGRPVATVPETSTVLLFAAALIALFGFGRSRA